jgi:23S rRNA (guanosine2251-2'-O)-methyltransferase
MSELTLIEGQTSVLAVLASKSRKVESILIAKETDRRKKLSLVPIIRRAENQGVPVKEIEREKIDELCLGKTHGGVAAYVGEREYFPLEKALETENGFFVLLDGVEDPYNFGQALRAVYAAGADGILLPERNWMSAAAVVARSSAGASEYINAISCDVNKALLAFKEKGYRIVVCDNTEKSVPMNEAELKKPLVLVVGGEKRGIHAELRALADVEARIEYGRDFKASLGAAPACSILAFEVLRQNS